LRFYDGRTAGSSWLHETPDMMTQATWDAWVEVPSETATKLGVANGDVLRVSSPHGTVELPAYVSPTIHPGAVAIPIGHRYSPFHRRYVTPAPPPRSPGSLLGGTVDPASGGLAYLGVKVTLAKPGARRPLAILLAILGVDDGGLVQPRLASQC